MTIAGLLRKHGHSASRYVDQSGKVLVGATSVAGVAPQVAYPVRSHTFHGGAEVADSGSDDGRSWWAQEGALDRDRRAVLKHFPGFSEVPGATDGHPPAWEGTIDTGYGQFRVRIEHRVDRGLPRVRPIDSKKRGKSRRGKWIPFDHLFLSGALCVAAESDWDPVEHTIADVIAWTAHWHAAYVSWFVEDVRPTPGFTNVA